MTDNYKAFRDLILKSDWKTLEDELGFGRKLIKDFARHCLEGEEHKDRCKKDCLEILEWKDEIHKKEMIELVKSLKLEIITEASDDGIIFGWGIANEEVEEWKAEKLKQLKDEENN